jgi:alpha/beta superfamily hydrolase
MSGWSEASAWSGDGLRREVFFFRSGGVELYGSLYASVEPSRPLGLVACSSWGVEADRTDPLVRSIALAVAKMGGAGMVFHYPGYGDSYGDFASVDMADLAEAARDASAEAARRCPDVAWSFAGYMLGASVASLASRSVDSRLLLLVQPALSPGAYFDRLRKGRGPLAPGPSPREMMQHGAVPGMAYGYPILHLSAESARGVEGSVATALEAFVGRGAIIRHCKPSQPDPAPGRFERVEVPGAPRSHGSHGATRCASRSVR